MIFLNILTHYYAIGKIDEMSQRRNEGLQMFALNVTQLNKSDSLHKEFTTVWRLAQGMYNKRSLKRKQPGWNLRQSMPALADSRRPEKVLQ